MEDDWNTLKTCLLKNAECRVVKGCGSIQGKIPLVVER